MRFRPGIPDDTEAVVAVWRVASAARRGLPSAAPGGEERLRRYIAQPDSFLIVADDSGEIVGMSLGMQEIDIEGDGSEIPDLCHIGALSVTPEFWGRGVGKGLVDTVLAEARARDYTRVQLWTHENNTRAQRFYEKRDFLLSGKTRLNARGEEMILYEREL